MRNVYFVFAILSTFLSTAQNQEIEITIHRFFEGLSQRNETAVNNVSSPKIVIIEDDVIWNLDSLHKNISRKRPDDYRRINNLKFISTEVNKDVAWATYENEAKITGNGKSYLIRWLETAILLFTENKWKIKVLHSTTIERRNL